jgi:sigma-B regulation protein RsbU (phosphoserine phosphatase)
LTEYSATFASAAATSSAFSPRKVLVVDDSRAQRTALRLQLSRWGYEVTEAQSGQAALSLCRKNSFDIILSDWVMPEMDGVTFCRNFRALQQENYGYFVLLTSKSEKAEIAKGLESGADDYLTKPVTSEELRARLRAGERILHMQEELHEKNTLVSSTLSQLQKVYDSLDLDLIEARKLQLALVRDRQRDYGAGKVSVVLRPSGHVGGDLVGSFAIDAARIAVFAVDVSGHGVASAMMTARLAGLFTGSSPDQNIALRKSPDGGGDAWPPSIVARRLNELLLEDWHVDQYFTFAYAEIDLNSGAGKPVQAGHPHPVLLRATGEVQELGDGDLPIGLIANAMFDEVAFILFAGDRLIITSDGVTECCDARGQEIGQECLVKILQSNAKMMGLDLLEALVWDLQTHRAGADFDDDVSAVVLDYAPITTP